jgi:hypothetical protein
MLLLTTEHHEISKKGNQTSPLLTGIDPTKTGAEATHRHRACLLFSTAENCLK